MISVYIENSHKYKILHYVFENKKLKKYYINYNVIYSIDNIR